MTSEYKIKGCVALQHTLFPSVPANRLTEQYYCTILDYMVEY